MYPFKIINKKKYLLLFANAFLYNLCVYSIPVILSIFLTNPFSIEKFAKFIILIIILKFLERVFNIIWIIKGYSFVEETKNQLYLAYYKRLCNMNISNLNNTHTGYLKKQLDNVINETGELLDGMMLTLNGFFIATTLFLIQAFTQSILIFILCIVFIIVIVFCNIVISRHNLVYQNKYNQKYSSYNSTLVDFLQNIKIIKNFDAYSYSTNIINEKFNSCKGTLNKINFFKSLRFDGINFLVSLLYIIILLNLLLQMKSGVEVFSYILFYTSIFNNLSTELNSIAKLFIRYTNFKSANDEVEKLIIEENQFKVSKWHSVNLKDIEFKYFDEGNNVIKIPDFLINKKDKISIVGESGQGKTTLFLIILRYCKVDDKKYLIDGKPTFKVPDVAYISQDVELFDLSIKDNLCLGKDISEEVLNKYLEDAGLLEWINSLENGINTVVGEKGVKLSAGQKQRINIIRGILLNKEIYIFDEPTSNLDGLSEEKISNMIEKYLRNKTCIIATHRQKLTEICNKHYFFENKTLCEKIN